MVETYYTISLKWTHKNDRWITFHRTENRGYCWRKDWAGTWSTGSKELTNNVDQRYIDSSKLDDLWETVLHAGFEFVVLPNTKKVRQAIGINQNEFISKYKSE